MESTMKKTNKQFTICKTTDFPVGERKIVEVDGKSIGVFNVKGAFYALLNYCPHTGAELCKGLITGTDVQVDDYEHVYGFEGELIRCETVGRTAKENRQGHCLDCSCLHDGELTWVELTQVPLRRFCCCDSVDWLGTTTIRHHRRS